MELSILALATSASIGITQVLKVAGLPGKFAPLTSLFIGVIASCVFSGSFTWIAVGTGIVGGLTASGLWSGTKATTEPTV